MKLFDAHCHTVPAADVAGAAVCGTRSKDWKNVLENFPNLGKEKCAPMQLVPMIGIHPWFVSKPWKQAEPAPDNFSKHWKNDFQTLEKILLDFPMLGIGECGLDFSDKFQNRAEQEECFIAHLELGRELDRPVTVHCVQAWGKMLEILREYPQPKKILHAFSGAAELIPKLTELNGWFSFGPAVLNPNAKKARAAVAAVPDERLLIETDSDGEPGKLMPVARAVAELRGASVEEIAELTFTHAERLFDVNGPASNRQGN